MSIQKIGPMSSTMPSHVKRRLSTIMLLYWKEALVQEKRNATFDSRYGGQKNDLRRNSAKEIPISLREVSNMKVLAEMLDEKDADDLVFKAEIMRELGCFGDAKALLEKSVDKSMRDVVEFIMALCERGDRYVTEIRFQ